MFSGILPHSSLQLVLYKKSLRDVTMSQSFRNQFWHRHSGCRCWAWFSWLPLSMVSTSVMPPAPSTFPSDQHGGFSPRPPCDIEVCHASATVWELNSTSTVSSSIYFIVSSICDMFSFHKPYEFFEWLAMWWCLSRPGRPRQAQKLAGEALYRQELPIDLYKFKLWAAKGLEDWHVIKTAHTLHLSVFSPGCTGADDEDDGAAPETQPLESYDASWNPAIYSTLAQVLAIRWSDPPNRSQQHVHIFDPAARDYPRSPEAPVTITTPVRCFEVFNCQDLKRFDSFIYPQVVVTDISMGQTGVFLYCLLEPLSRFASAQSIEVWTWTSRTRIALSISVQPQSLAILMMYLLICENHAS